MKLFTCTDHDAHWPVGCASIVLAENEQQARELLDAELHECGLKTSDAYSYTLKEVPLDTRVAIVLNDGEY